MFHGVYETIFENISSEYYFGMHVDEFEKTLNWFSKENLNIINTNDLMEGKPGVHITFDDGYANNFEIAFPILKKFRYPALVFVTTKHVRENNKSKSDLLLNFREQEQKYQKKTEKQLPEKFIEENWNGLTKKQILELSDSNLFEIGCHTVSHPLLTSLKYSVQYEEIQNSKSTLESITGKSVNYFSYPFGAYDHNSLRVIEELKFKAAFSVYPNKINGKYKYQLPRIGLYSGSNFYLNGKINFWKSTIKSHLLNEI